MRTIRDSDDRVVSLVLFESEVCGQTGLSAQEIRAYGELFPPTGIEVHPDRERPEPIFNLTRDELEQYVRFAKILQTGMSVDQVRELVSRDIESAKLGRSSQFVEMYALLAEECPPGITAHAMRSYCAIFLHQRRRGVMLLPSDLARAANVSEDTARRHIQYLQAVGMLTMESNPDRWEFALVPKALTRHFKH